MFWAMMLLTAALCALLAAVGSKELFSGVAMWKIWPAVLVLLGFGLLLRIKLLKTVLYSLGGIAAGVAVYSGFIATQTFTDNLTASPAAVVHRTQQFRQAFDKSIQTSVFNFQSGAVSLTLADTSAELIAADIESGIGDYSFDSEMDDDSLISTTLSMHKTSVDSPDFLAKNKVALSLNTKPEWRLNFDMGAAAAHIDLRRHTVRSLAISCGASNIALKLPAANDSSEVLIEGGVLKADIEIPDSAGCEIVSTGGANSMDFNGFTLVEDDVWRTPGFAGAEKKIFLELRVTVSTIRVRRVK